MFDIHSEEYILGQNIRKYRKLKGWSQTDLSNAVDVNRTDISKYENGSKGAMGYKTLKKFATALDVSIDQLVDEESSFFGDSTIQSLYNQLNASNKVMAEQLMRSLLLQQNIAV